MSTEDGGSEDGEDGVKVRVVLRLRVCSGYVVCIWVRSGDGVVQKVMVTIIVMIMITPRIHTLCHWHA